MCNNDKDCVLHERHVCDDCPSVNPAWRTPVNRKTFEEWEMGWGIIYREAVHCPNLRWLGNKAVCLKGQCAVRQVEPLRSGSSLRRSRLKHWPP